MDITNEELEDFEIEASEVQRIYARINESQNNATTYWVDL
jgi:hypothetical protein